VASLIWRSLPVPTCCSRPLHKPRGRRRPEARRLFAGFPRCSQSLTIASSDSRLGKMSGGDNSHQPLDGNLLVHPFGGGGGGGSHVFRIEMSNPLAPHFDECP